MKTKMTNAATPDTECPSPVGSKLNDATITKALLVPAIRGYQRLHVIIADRGPEVQHDRFVTADLPMGGRQWSHGHYFDTLSDAEFDFSSRVGAWDGRRKAQRTRHEADALRSFDITRSPGHAKLLAKGFSWAGDLKHGNYIRERLLTKTAVRWLPPGIPGEEGTAYIEVYSLDANNGRPAGPVLVLSFPTLNAAAEAVKE